MEARACRGWRSRRPLARCATYGLASRRLGQRRATDQRVLIPIRSANGQIAGIIGRNVGDPRYPKYKNPPRTHLYDKSVNLYQPLPTPSAKDDKS